MSNSNKTRELFKDSIPAVPEGYYSEEKPNPALHAFAERHRLEKPYDQVTDDYAVPAFAKPIETTKATAIYNMHTYWSKKPHDAIRQYVEHYTRPGDLVLDPFSGSGGTALAALMVGRKAIAMDRSPAAAFITKNYCTPVDPDALQAAFAELKAKVQPVMKWLYETRCHLTDKPAETAFTVYSQVFQCPRCLEKIPLFDCEEAQSFTAAGKPKTINICPHCHKKGVTEEIRSQSQKFGSVPVLVSYTYYDGGKQVQVERRHNDADQRAREYFEKYDLAKIKELEALAIPFWFPSGFSMTSFSRYQRDALRLYGITEVADMFTKRNLWALAAIRDGLRTLGPLSDPLLFGFEAILINLCRMQGYSTDPRFPNNLFKGTYYIPQVGKEYSVLPWYEGKIQNLVRGYSKINSLLNGRREIMISRADAAEPWPIPSDSVDFIFTDPPYAEKVQYGELNYVWEAWLGFDTTWLKDEIIVNSARGISETDWAAKMLAAMREAYRVLKPGRWLSLCFHDTAEGTWQLVQEIMHDAGFVPGDTEEAVYIDAKQKSRNQLTADKVTKRDLVINFRKPKSSDTNKTPLFSGEEDQQTFREKAQGIVREFLKFNPGTSIDRIYDEVVSRLVRKGQMEAHDFGELLSQVADEVKQQGGGASRWYLKDTEAGAEDSERATADNAGTRIHEFLAKSTATKLKESDPKLALLHAEIAKRRHKLQAVDHGKSDESRGKLVREIREHSDKLAKLESQRAEWENQAVDYSQIFEFYVAAVNPKPKTSLLEILEDYCYQTEEGYWRPPNTEPEKQEKSNERQKAVRRKIQRVYNFLADGREVPSNQQPDTTTLLEWIRHCRRTGLHAQGKLLYEHGGLNLSDLSEDDQISVQEDYEVCVRALARARGSQAAKASKQQNMNL